MNQTCIHGTVKLRTYTRAHAILRFPNAKRSTSNVDSEVGWNDCKADGRVGRTSASHSPRLGHRKMTRAPTKLLPVQSEFPSPSWSPTQVPRGRSPTRDRETNATQTFPPAVARKVPSSPCHARSESDGHCEGRDRDQRVSTTRSLSLPKPVICQLHAVQHWTRRNFQARALHPQWCVRLATHYPQRLPG